MKSTNVKRFFTILMTLVMLASILSAAVSAAPSGAGIGAADNVIINETPVEEMPLENDNDLTEPVVTYEIPFTKTVKQGGEALPVRKPSSWRFSIPASAVQRTAWKSSIPQP